MASECKDEAKMGEVPLDFDESSMFRLISKTHVMLLREIFNTHRNFTRWDLIGTNSQNPASWRWEVEESVRPDPRSFAGYGVILMAAGLPLFWSTNPEGGIFLSAACDIQDLISVPINQYDDYKRQLQLEFVD